MPLSQPADACLAFIAAQPNYRMLLLSCSNHHYGLFSSKDLRIDLNPRFGIHESSCGYLCPMPAGLSCSEVYTQYRLRVRYSIRIKPSPEVLKIKRSLGIVGYEFYLD
jgi:hypothetical protein